MFEIYTRVGVPQEVLSDMGTQFTSEVMKEVGRLLAVKQLTTTPYHPICNGLVERFNGTLKKMLRRMCAERPSDWDRYLPALLFAYREAPQESLGFAPFELLYGRTVRGPLTILKELWSGELDQEEVKNTYQYVVDLRERLDKTCQMAQEELRKASKRYKKYYDARTKDRKFSLGDKVLVLLPTKSNKLLMQWKGPYDVEEKVAKHDYKVKMGSKIKTIHANLLKKYISRESDDANASVLQLQRICSCIISNDEENGISNGIESDNDMSYYEKAEVVKLSEKVVVDFPSIVSKECVNDVRVADDLNLHQVSEVKELLSMFQDVLTDVPGRTNIIQHTIHLTSQEPIRSKPYQVPHAMVNSIKNEIQSMLMMGVIEASTSPYASPVVLVEKKDKSIRFCVDYRKLNRITVFDPEPIPNIDSLMVKIAKGQFFSKFDLTKGYWQVPIAKEDKEKTAFVTLEGLFQFTVLPFGLVNAPAVFSRMMRRVLGGIEHTLNYIDDILIYTETFEKHLKVIESVLKRLREVGLTARPSKCSVGFKSLEFLGHVVGKGILRPNRDNVSKILESSRPMTKKQVRSFLGMVGYYQKFIPNYAGIAAPLSDLTRKGYPEKVKWGEAQEKAYSTLKARISSAPILHLPDLRETFILRTDASDVGLGAVLMQQHGDTKFPICFASKKLQPRERAYSVVERECLALVWAVNKFYAYLYGNEFVLETDHHSLSFISKAKLNNARVMRWALSLQPYRYVVKAIKGIENVGADFLSRCPMDMID